jgi:hypothetical protein
MIDPQALLTDLKRQVTVLDKDLREQAVGNLDLEREWREAREASRTAASYESWLGERVTQVAVAWVLGTVFVRFCEDNGLVDLPVIAGPGDRTAVARERQQAFFEEHPELTDRDWIAEGFNAMKVAPAAASLFESHNPMWEIPPSNDAAKELLAFWRATDAHGAIVYDFTDPEWNTRFLGDLYQNLSEHARDTYALLQTPEFVEEFILDYTLDPAIEEFGLEPEPPVGHEYIPRRLRVIDPACGSGHFLLGAFHRILDAWEAQAGDTDKWTLIRWTLESVHGVDKNPFAVAIARFRLMLAAMNAGGVTKLSEKVNFPLNVAVGDSLLHGSRSSGVQGSFDELTEDEEVFTYRTEDVGVYMKKPVYILEFGTYHAVFANPPYITVKDKAEGDEYRKRYLSCYRQYSLSVPFAERIFNLAVLGPREGFGAGYTGQITANSFMKREFGKKLIEEFLAEKIDLTHVIDTSGAYIPGHGTPTVILFGRRRWPDKRTTIRAVLGIRGEPTQPPVPAEGKVWKAIETLVNQPGSESEWVSVVDLDRGQLTKHPWSLTGGGADDLKSRLEAVPARLGEVIDETGFGAVTREDDAYMVGAGSLRRLRVSADEQRAIVEGDVVRDFGIWNPTISLWPYETTNLSASAGHAAQAMLWPYRVILRDRVAYGQTQIERGLAWFEYSMFFRKRFKSSLILTFAFVATHNHFVLDRGGKVFNRSAPVIKLPEGASEDDHLALLGILNSSTACFWLKQVSYPKGGDPMGDEGARVSAESWSDRYEFTGTKLEQFPLPAELPLSFGRELDRLARRLAEVEPSAVCGAGVPTREALNAARAEYERIRGQMIAVQEELDWDVYRRYGLLEDLGDAVLHAGPGAVPELRLGERAFEIVLARKMAAGEAETQWFARHGSTPITEIPAHWPRAYKDVVARRIEVIERDRNIGLIERPECKRRWQSESWEKKESAALIEWLLDRCEERPIWYDASGQPAPMTVNRLADQLRADADVVSVARLFKGPDADLGSVLAEIIADEHVPYLAQLRYKPEGLFKRNLWERTWDLQREEDATGKRLDIPVPPKYKSSDFAKTSYWSHRGKLDVPKERFISYPYANPDGDESLLIGWAGWDHREQASALINLIEERANTDGWEIDRIKPLLVGLAEVMPWVRQWHNEVDDRFGESPADAYDRYLLSQQEKYGLSADDLRAWNPPAPSRGRRRG